MIPSRTMPRMMVILNFENWSIARYGSASTPESSVVRALLGLFGIFLGRRLGRFRRPVDDVGDGVAHDADLHVLGDLDLDIVIGFVGLGDDAEQAARGHDPV